MADSVRIKRGVKARLPKSLPLGELAFCTDTEELYVGAGAGLPLKKVKDQDVLKMQKDLSSHLNTSVRELNGKIHELASTGTTMEAVQEKVEDMAEKGLIQAYTLGNNTVEPKKTTFFEYSKNLYNPNDPSVKDGYYYKYSTGYMQHSDYTTIKIDDLKVGDIIRTNKQCRFISSFNATSNHNSVENTTMYTVQEGTTAIVLSFGVKSKDSIMIVKNEELPNNYVPYKAPFIKNENMDISQQPVSITQITDKKDLVLSLANLEEVTASINLLNPEEITEGYYLGTGGKLIENNAYCTSGKIPYTPNTQYSLEYLFGRVWFYDTNDKEIGYTDTNVSMFTTPPTKGYFRYSFAKQYKDITQVVKGDILPDYLPYGYKIMPSKYIEPISIAQIKDKENLVLSLDNLEEIVISKNLLNLEEITEGYYLGSGGKLLENKNYCTSGKIPYKTSTEYSLAHVFGRVWFYDTNDREQGYTDTNVSKLTTPSAEGYFRFSFAKQYTDTAQVAEGEDLPDYLPYGYKFIPSKYIEGLNNGINDEFELKLPKEIIVAVGTTMELYNEQICQCGNINNFHFLYSCSKGKTLRRKWEYTPTNNDIGNAKMEVKVYNNNCKLIATQIVNIKTIKNTVIPSVPITVMQIGDSLSNDKVWYDKILELSKSLYGKEVIKFVGTCGRWDKYKHEGRSGYSSGGYVTDSSYDWQPHVRVQATITTMPVSKKQYKIDGKLYEFEMSRVENGITWLYFNNLFASGGCPATSGKAIAVESGTQGDITINYSNLEITSGNPFWDSVNNKVSMAYYTKQTGIRPNIVQIMLGTNGLNAENDATNINILVEAIRKDWGNIPVHICCIPYYANQDGLGIQFGNNVLDILRHKQVFEHHKKIMDTFETKTNVKVIAVGQTMDREYNYGNVETKVNKYNETKELMPVEATHCQLGGYHQFAETMLSSLIDSINRID